MAIKIRRKTFRQKIKEPDEFISFSEKTLGFLKENINTIAIVSFVFVVIVFSVGIFIQRSKAQKEEFFKEMYDEIMLANSNFSDGLYDIAEKSFEEIIQKSDKLSIFNEIAKVGLGYAYMDNREYEKAIKLFEELASRDDLQYPKEELYKNITILYEKTGKTEKAIEIYNKLITLYPDSLDIANYRHKASIIGKN